MEKSVSIDYELFSSLKNFSHLLNTKLPDINTTTEKEKEEKSIISDPNTQPTHENDGVCNFWNNSIQKVLFSSAQISERVRSLGNEITSDYSSILSQGDVILAVGLLTGAFVFMSDLLRNVNIRYLVDFMVVSSYGNATISSNNIKVKKDLSLDPAGKHILIIEDIIDTGHTLDWVTNMLKQRSVKSIRIATLLDKKARRRANSTFYNNIQKVYSGFECPDDFVVGYGLDYCNEYRCVPFIAVLKPEIYSTE